MIDINDGGNVDRLAQEGDRLAEMLRQRFHSTSPVIVMQCDSLEIQPGDSIYIDRSKPSNVGGITKHAEGNLPMPGARVVAPPKVGDLGNLLIEVEMPVLSVPVAPVIPASTAYQCSLVPSGEDEGSVVENVQITSVAIDEKRLFSWGYEIFQPPPFTGYMALHGDGTITPRSGVSSRPDTCHGCRNYYGGVDRGQKMICAIHPYGVESLTCEDWETHSDADGPYCSLEAAQRN